MTSRTLIILFTLSLFSCSHMEEGVERTPAEGPKSCLEMVKNFLRKNSDENQRTLEKALTEKKLLSFSNKFVTIQHPRLEWMNRAKSSLIKSIKNWNNNKYPAFYIFNDEDVVTHARQYFQTMNSMVNPEVKVAPDATKNLEAVTSWIKNFESYQREIDQLLEERISLQYNLTLLQKLKLTKYVEDVKITIKRNGVFQEEILTLRKSDKDLPFQIKRFKSQIQELDGTIISNGRIKDRIIRQAFLQDALTILQREFEYAVKNSANPDPELTNELERINGVLNTQAFAPSTYGVYRITNDVFAREVLALSKLDVAYKKFLDIPLVKIKSIMANFLTNAKNTEEEKMGFLKRAYAKISSITPLQAGVGGGIVTVAGVGLQRYHSLRSPEVTETHESKTPHEEQMERTEEEVVKRSEGHSEVIEIQMEELTNE